MSKRIDFTELDSITAELAQPIIAGSEDARNALIDLSLAIVKKDTEGFAQALSHPSLKDIHTRKNSPYILRNANQFMQTEKISFAGYLGFYNNTDLIDLYCQDMNDKEKNLFVLDALHGAKHSTRAQDTIKHIVRKYDINLSAIMPEDFSRLIRRKDYDTMAFLLAKGACPNALGLLGARPPLFEALHQKDDTACEILLAANVMQVIADTPESHNFIDSIEISNFIETHTDHLLFRKWLANQSGDIKVKPHKTLQDLRDQTYEVEYKGHTYKYNGLMVKAMNRNFDEVIKLMINTGECLTKDDLYKSQGGDVCVMDMLNHPDFENDNILKAEYWSPDPRRIKQFYKTLKPYDQYYRETSLMTAGKVLFNPEVRMQDVRKKMQGGAPLRRRPKPRF